MVDDPMTITLDTFDLVMIGAVVIWATINTGIMLVSAYGKLRKYFEKD